MSFKKHIEMAAHELGFWKEFVQTERFLKGWVRAKRTPELQDVVFDFVAGLTKNNPSATVLDVGSGVVSILHGAMDKRNLTAVDPMAPLYAFVFDYAKHGIVPPSCYAAEDLPWENAFDLVHISNALDHAQDPQKAMSSMMRAVRPGGFLLVCGFENEGTAQACAGMHQWNIEFEPAPDEGDDDDMLIRSAVAPHFISERYAGKILLRKQPIPNRTWTCFMIQKPK